MTWLISEWRLLVPLVLGWLAVCWMLPKEPARSRVLAGLLGIAALLMLAYYHMPPGQVLLPAAIGSDAASDGIDLPPEHDWVSDLVINVLFYVFALAAVSSAALMITDRNPVYAALWFAVTTLAVCGLFLLNSAPFLAAATVIVYAGAIVVTFLFVIMLAQQAGAANCDQRSYQPAAASTSAFLLLGCLLFTLQSWGKLQDDPTPLVPDPQQQSVPQKFARSSENWRSNRLSQPADGDLGSLKNIGRSLFTDYLYAVELAGTVLLIATIGAMAIAPSGDPKEPISVTLENQLAVGAILFILGMIGFLTRRNLILIMLSAELMLHGVSVNLTSFGRHHHNASGQAFTIFVLTIAACEAGLALALILTLYQRRKSLDVFLWGNLSEPNASQPIEKSPMKTPPAHENPHLTPAGSMPKVPAHSGSKD